MIVSVCVAGKLGAVLDCSSVFVFHYRSFLLTCGKGVLKGRNEDDYKEKPFSEFWYVLQLDLRSDR